MIFSAKEPTLKCSPRFAMFLRYAFERNHSKSNKGRSLLNAEATLTAFSDGGPWHVKFVSPLA